MSAWARFLAWIESSTLGEWIRGSGVWTYGVLNLVHILGIATLFGAILVLDLRLLGWRRNVSLADVAHFTLPASMVGFGLAVASGVCLLATNGTEYASNPFLPIKFVAIAVAVVNALALSQLTAWKTRTAGDPSAYERTQLAIFGAISLLSWLTAVGAGRLIGYW